jgi:hypothetical protein
MDGGPVLPARLQASSSIVSNTTRCSFRFRSIDGGYGPEGSTRPYRSLAASLVDQEQAFGMTF